MVGEIGDRRGTAQPLGEFWFGPAYLLVQFLHAAAHPDAPSLVPEVLLQLTGDGGNGEVSKRDTPRDVEPVDRVDESNGGHLYQVVHRLAGMAVATGFAPGNVHTAVDDLFSQLDSGRVGRIHGRQSGQRVVGFVQAVGCRLGDVQRNE